MPMVERVLQFYYLFFELPQDSVVDKIPPVDGFEIRRGGCLFFVDSPVEKTFDAGWL
jgi:hypothetical protein